MSTDSNKQIMAKNIKYYMEKKGVTNQQLCDALGFKYTTFMDWIKGITYPRIGKVEAMANYFGCGKSDLIEEKVEKEPQNEVPVALSAPQGYDNLTDEQKIVGASMKTDYRRQRDIMLPDIIIPVIQAALAASPQKSDNLIAMNTDKFYESYHKMQQQIGIRDLTPYCCRHTTASVLAKNESIAPTLITRVMRQKLPITTERYKHADEQQILETLNAIKNPMKHSNI